MERERGLERGGRYGAPCGRARERAGALYDCPINADEETMSQDSSNIVAYINFFGVPGLTVALGSLHSSDSQSASRLF